MKAFLVFVFTVIFLAGGALAAGHMEMCPTLAKPTAQPQMPCHDDVPQKSSLHCSGVCLCQHAALMHSALPAGGSVSYIPAMVNERPALTHQNITTRTLAPPRRPPKFL